MTISKNTRRVFTRVALIALGTAALGLSACNTVKGAGKDLQEASENTQKALSGDSSHD